MTIDRLPNKYSARLRRFADQAKQDVADHESRIIVLEGGTSGISIDIDYIDLTGDATENLAVPTADKQFVWRTVNTRTSGTYTLDFGATEAVSGNSGSTVGSLTADSASSSVLLMSGEYDSTLRWFIIYSSFSAGP